MHPSRLEAVQRSDLSNNITDHRAKEAKWLKCLESAGNLKAFQTNEKILKLAREGVPGSLRSRVWGYLCDVEGSQQKYNYQHILSLPLADDIKIEIEKDLSR